jgi:deoxyadenosine/deoxycytidine kinase
MAAYISRLVKLKEMLKVIKRDDIIIMERCVYSDYNIFARMLYETDKINDIEYQVYKKWFNYFMEDVPCIIFIYIKTDFDNCHDRVVKRGRKGENNISKEYLKKCEDYHEQWLNMTNNKIVLDGNKDKSFHGEYLKIIQDLCNNEEFKDNKQ